LTTIRQNFHRILCLFSKELDAAYLGHRSLLVHGDEAEQMLVQNLKDTLGDFLFYFNTGEYLNKESIELWIESYIKEKDFPILTKKGKKHTPDISFKRDKDLLIKVLFSGEKNVESRLKTAFTPLIEDKGQTKDKRNPYIEYLLKNSTLLFTEKFNLKNSEKLDINFAKLTHHKNLFLPHRIPPLLTLGTIIRCLKKKKKEKDRNNFYICIQQRCDSIRIKDGEERKFLFLPLVESKDGELFDTLSSDGTKFRTDNKSFTLRTIRFKRTSEKGLVLGEKNSSGKYIFESIYGDKFEWILDLKDLYSQKIVSEYAAELFRVGIDVSEWLRRNASS
jgi:hypothetical protein